MHTWFLFTCIIICTTTANVFVNSDAIVRQDSPLAPHYHGNPLYGEFTLPEQLEKNIERKHHLNLYGCRSTSCEVGDVPRVGNAIPVPVLAPPPPPPVLLHEITLPAPENKPQTQGGAVNFILYNQGVKYKQRERSNNELDEVKLKFNCILIAGQSNQCYGWNVDKKKDAKKPGGSKKSNGEKKKTGNDDDANGNPSGDSLPPQLPLFVRNNIVARGSRRGRVTLRDSDTSSYVNIQA